MVLVVDSIVPATGGDPSDPTIPSRYFGALQRMGVPSLSLAHVTKVHDPTYPFGSAFWHNLARVTWSLMPKGEDILLTMRKSNNYQKPPAQTVIYTWQDGVLREVWERKASVVLLDRILEVLEDGPATTSDIAGMLNDGVPTGERVSVDTVGRTLRREASRRGSKVSGSDGTWTISA